jgi:hypothetical protein
MAIAAELLRRPDLLQQQHRHRRLHPLLQLPLLQQQHRVVTLLQLHPQLPQ